VRIDNPRLAEIAAIARTVTVAPWTLRRGTLPDEDLLHVVALSAYFGHLNRIADAVAVPLDYEVQRLPPPADPSVPALAPAPHAVTSPPALDLAMRPATRDAMEAWRAYVFDRASTLPLAEIATAVAAWLGDGTTTVPDFDNDIRALCQTVTLAPWQLVDESFAALRARRRWDDAALFEVCVVASTAGVNSRIRVALASL
jgi:hypothetical protein